MMNAILQFKSYDVLEQIYVKNEEFVTDEIKNLSFETKFSIQKEDSEALIYLSISSGDLDPNQSNYFLRVKIKGEFTFELDSETDDDKLIESLVKGNGLAILFPYIRSLISDLTSKGKENPLIIPTMNIAEFLNEEQ